MAKFSLDEIIAATGGRCEWVPAGPQEGEPCGGPPGAPVFSAVCTDSRNVVGGEIFFALTGAKFDGHDFAAQAVAKGARGIVASRFDKVAGLAASVPVVVVDDPLKALQRLARYHRCRLGIPVVAVTGSTGKTTTKDMAHSIFMERMRSARTEENFNNEVGVPLTLLALDPRHEICVVEIGMRGKGQIRELAEIVRPDVGVVTNVGPSHVELLGSVENVALAKAELVEALGPDGVAVLNADCEYTAAMKDKTCAKAVFFGIDHDADVRASDIEVLGEAGTRFTMSYGQRSFRVHVPVPGVHHVYDALAAGAAALVMGLDSFAVAQGLAHFEPSHGRSGMVETPRGFTVIDDTYNANPASMKAALAALRDVAGGRRKIAVLGNMLELGEISAEAHRELGRAAVAHGCDVLVTVGDLARLAGEEALRLGKSPRHVVMCSTNAQAVNALDGLVEPGDVILVKGSRAMRMEEVVRALVGDTGGRLSEP
ncbi:MAG TPA: UDP-N-acetylmuramoyl-tripeptide--D-alanyl-D-alanine ligase [Firmicutes bacterium]|nr:UDP-N-acetylmuramoyl-tripeptide--D-alanyl-D-alanine ligase [Bacillota bacterium]